MRLRNVLHMSSPRRALQIALGLLWLTDGILQAQQQMFTPEFFGMMLRMNMAEPPAWLWDVESHVEPILTAHAWPANALCAAAQLLIGLGILWRRTTRVAIAASIPWAVTVWLFGESIGGLFTPGASALTGAPGAALLYAVVGLLVFPYREKGFPSVVWTRIRQLAPPTIWSGLWIGTGLLELESFNRSGLIAGSAISAVGRAEPSLFSSINHGVGNVVFSHGPLVATIVMVVQIAIGVMIWSRRWARAALVAGIAISLLYGLVGQDFGGVFSNGIFGELGSGATDPGTGPILVLLALALWPWRGLPAVARSASQAPALAAAA